MFSEECKSKFKIRKYVHLCNNLYTTYNQQNRTFQLFYIQNFYSVLQFINLYFKDLQRDMKCKNSSKQQWKCIQWRNFNKVTLMMVIIMFFMHHCQICVWTNFALKRYWYGVSNSQRKLETLFYINIMIC